MQAAAPVMIQADDRTMQSNNCKDSSVQKLAEISSTGSPVSKEDVDTIVERALGPNAKVLSYKLKSYTDEQLGFLGAYYHLEVIVRNDAKTEKTTHTYFVKSVPYSNAEQASLCEDCGAFLKEATFYQKIYPELQRDVRDTSWVAQCYLASKDTLVFEDLKARNFALKDKLLDVPFLQSAVSGAAKLHAASMLAEKRLGRKLNEVFPKGTFRESLFDRNLKFHHWITRGAELAEAIAKDAGLDHSNVAKVMDRIFDLTKTSKTRRNVVCHGDLKSWNLMFDDSWPVPKCILVDFQLIRYAPAMTDLLQMLYLAAERTVREENEEELLRHYHEVLCETLRDGDAEIELPTLEEIIQEYEELRLVGVVTTVLYSPINLMDSKLCAQMTKDSEGFSDILTGDRIGVTREIMRQDPVYKTRITEMVTELVQRSKKLLAT